MPVRGQLGGLVGSVSLSNSDRALLRDLLAELEAAFPEGAFTGSGASSRILVLGSGADRDLPEPLEGGSPGLPPTLICLGDATDGTPPPADAWHLPQPVDRQLLRRILHTEIDRALLREGLAAYRDPEVHHVHDRWFEILDRLRDEPE